MLVELEQRYPECEKHVFSLGHREIDIRRLDAFLEEPHPSFFYKGRTPYLRQSRNRRIVQQLGLEAWRASRLIECLSLEFKDLHPVSSARDYEAVSLAGGEQWGGFSSGITMFAILEAISEINPNVFIFPFSVKRKLLDSYLRGRLERCFAKISGKLLSGTAARRRQ